MLTIRFARVGRKNKAQYKIVLQEHTVAPGGHHVEILGSYDPHSKNATIKEDRVKYWIKKGAQPSDTTYNLFISKGIVTGEKRKVRVSVKKTEEDSVETKPVETPSSEVPETKEEIKKVKAEEPKKEESKKEELKKEETPKEENN